LPGVRCHPFASGCLPPPSSPPRPGPPRSPPLPPPFSRLASTLLAGQAVTLTTPTGTLGGDAVRAWMLRDQVSLRESLPSLVIVKTTASAAQGAILLIGILLAR